MTASLVQFKTGAGTTSSVIPAFDNPTTPGNLVVLTFATDIYNTTPPAEWTQAPEMEQQTYHGEYIWYRTADSSATQPAYIVDDNYPSVWILAEWAGLEATPYDISEGQFLTVSGDSYTIPGIQPTLGQRVIIAAFGGSAGNSAGNMSLPYTLWTDDFIHIATSYRNTNPKLCNALAYKIVDADGSTVYNGGVNYPDTVQSRSGLAISFKIAQTNSIQKLLTESDQSLKTEDNKSIDLTSVEPVEFTDNFNRTNGALGSDWNSDAKWKIQSNVAVYDSAGTQGLMVPNFTVPYDHFMQFDYHANTWPMVGSANNAVVAFLRMNGNQFNGYMFQIWQSEYNQQQIEVVRYNNGVLTELIYDVYGGYDRLQDHTFWFGVKGREIYVVVDGLLYCKLHDTPNANGSPHDGAISNANVGLSEVDWIGLGTVSIDNFVTGSFGDGKQFIIFSDNFTAADGTDWNTRGTYKKGWEIDAYSATNHGKIVNNRLRLYSGTGAYGNRGATLFHGTSTSPSVGTIPTNDFELTTDVVVGPFTTNPRMWFSLLENNDAIGWTVYCDQGGYAYITRSRGWSSSGVSVDGGGISYSPGDVVHWKIRCTPTSCKFKIWKNGASEPTTWNNVLEYFDPMLPKGGLLSFKVSTWDTGEDVYMDLDNINVTCY